jgi:hypothetical protein
MIGSKTASPALAASLVGLVLISACCSILRPRAQLGVNLKGPAYDVAVEVLRLEGPGKETFVEWKLPKGQSVLFDDLPLGHYRVLVEPEADSLARECIESVDVVLGESTSNVIAMTVPEGTVKIYANFTSVRPPSWWSPSNVVPVRVTKATTTDPKGSRFRLYLWLREQGNGVWRGDLRFLDVGVYTFTLFEHDMVGDVINDLVTTNVTIRRDVLDDGLLNISF